ncbi:MAG: DJ-1/PfpI family protein [Myxococcales bacterium]|jgi:transcriptional regulator GlxA family with amidase domain|nr:DJ-1/PfpI family protein [Myxococcales bacterium]
MSGPRRIAVLLFEGVEELDFAGPWEVLAAWADQFPDDGIEVFTIADLAGPIRCAKGLQVLADHRREAAPAFDLLILPGGRGTRPLLKDDAMLAWLRDLAERGVTIASVCTGALVLAKAGLLDGKPATTHHGSLTLLAELGRDIDVQPDARFVDNGTVMTAAGVSAGIDLALHLVMRMHSVERARQVRRYIQYDPSPPI